MLSSNIQVSPDHCSCGSSDNCVEIPSFDLNLDADYPDTCTPAAYISTNLVDEFKRVLFQGFFPSETYRLHYSPNLSSCQQWKDDYLSPNSRAASDSLLTC